MSYSGTGSHICSADALTSKFAAINLFMFWFHKTTQYSIGRKQSGFCSNNEDITNIMITFQKFSFFRLQINIWILQSQRRYNMNNDYVSGVLILASSDQHCLSEDESRRWWLCFYVCHTHLLTKVLCTQVGWGRSSAGPWHPLNLNMDFASIQKISIIKHLKVSGAGHQINEALHVTTVAVACIATATPLHCDSQTVGPWYQQVSAGHSTKKAFSCNMSLIYTIPKYRGSIFAEGCMD